MKLSNFKLRQDRGVAGTTVLLGLIVSLFVIGLLVMIFALMGGSLQTASYDTTVVTVTNSSPATWLNQTNRTLITPANFLDFAGFNVTAAWNFSSNTVIPLANVTDFADGVVRSADFHYNSSQVNYSYQYSYSASNTATDVIGNTTTALSSVTDFFSLFIVIGSMVVLILLTVIIIVAIRQSGLLEGGTA